MITTIIEKYLLSIDQATFQKMMNHLFHLQGYKFLGSPGSVIGKNKTSKGSPDSFFEDGDNFIFCEFTTQEKLPTGATFFNKLIADIQHCFDVEKTGVEKDKISKVILAFTQELQASELSILKSTVISYNPKAVLEIYSIQEIPFKLVYYPGLADKYVPGVKTTNGTFYTLPDFLALTERGLQPSLTNSFVGRESEIKLAKEYLENTDLLIITGAQGVGKSKMAVQLSEAFEKESYEARVIVSSPVPLWEELNNFLLPDKNYIIFFDDANKSLPNLDYLLQFVATRPAGSIKIVITVRDYVRSDLNKYLLNLSYAEITLNILEDQQLKEVIAAAMPEGKFLEQIAEERILLISKGNSRLALMAISSTLKENNIAVLQNVASLYDDYFQKVQSEVEIISNQKKLQALGILSFFGVLDRKNMYTKEKIETIFGINWDLLWETFLELEKSELVDVFQGETAKISDQVLATYTFYKTFIDEKSSNINLSEWLIAFFDNYSSKIQKSITDVINTFGYLELKDRITTFLLVVQKRMGEDQKNLYQFFQLFWFYREIDTLLYVKKWIDNLETEDIPAEKINYEFNTNDFVHAPQYLNLLIKFWTQETAFTKEAIQLGLEIIFKKPSILPEVLKHLTDAFSIQRFDLKYGFPRQNMLLTALTSEELNPRNKIIAEQLFLSIAPSYLGWEFHQFEGKDGGRIAIYNFSLIKTEALMQLRDFILKNVISLYDRNKVKVFGILKKYFRTGLNFDNSIYGDEQKRIGDFFEATLSSDVYEDCKIVYDYVHKLKKQGITVDRDWSIFLNSETITIAKIFNPKFDYERLSFEQQEIIDRNRIKDFIRKKNIKFIQNCFLKIDPVYTVSELNHEGFQIETQLTYLLQELAEINIALFYSALKLLMTKNYSFTMEYANVIYYPLKKKLVPVQDFYNVINELEYRQKQNWKVNFFDALEESEINTFFLTEFIQFISNTKGYFYFHNLKNYIKFNSAFLANKRILIPSAIRHKNVITYIISILLGKKEKDYQLSLDHQICYDNYLHFQGKGNLLKQLFYRQKVRHHYDIDGKEMAAVSHYQPNFLIEYLKNEAKDISYLSGRFENLNVEFVWNLNEYEEILNQALEIIIEKSPIWTNFEHEANVLFKHVGRKEEEYEKAYTYISNFIRKHYKQKQHVQIIFNVVTYTFNDQVHRFFKEFLLLNHDVEFVKDMWLEKNEVTSGSRVPRIEQQIKFLKSTIELIASLPNPLNYAEHVRIWENEIEYAKLEKIEELKRDFTGYF